MATRPTPTVLLLALFTAALAGCGGSEASAEGSAAREPAGDPAELALRGEELFRGKGCNACHELGGGRLVGPDLADVTERREKDWIIAMIARPDSMLRNDSTARALLAEYYTPMQDVGVTPGQAEALYHYLRTRTRRAEPSGP